MTDVTGIMSFLCVINTQFNDKLLGSLLRSLFFFFFYFRSRRPL